MVEGLKLDPARPLIICDADEVLLQFISGLERFLETQGCVLDLTSFAIHGNVRHRDSGRPVANEDVTRFIASFFENHTRTMDVVPGAADALAQLSARAQIIILSNLPEVARIARTENLADHGIDYPVIAGSGLKGAAVKRMIGGFAQPVVFVDDLPPNIDSVATETPHVHRLHFVADPRLAKLLQPAKGAHRRIDDWPTARNWIESVIEGS
jgi:hypothetical protein